jgi:hypothetical protein
VQFVDLLKTLSSLNQSSYFFKVNDVYNSVVFYWKKHVNINASIMSAIFSFNQEYQNYFKGPEISDAKRWFIEFACAYLLTYNCSNTSDRSMLHGRIKQQYGDFMCKTSHFFELPSIIEQVIKTQQVQERRYLNPVNVWKYFIDDVPELTKSVLAILALPASEASVERSFSQQSLVHRKHRNRMREEQVETEMIIKYNLRPKNREGLVSSSGPASFLEVESENQFVLLFEIRQQILADPEEEEAEEEIEEKEPEECLGEEQETNLTTSSNIECEAEIQTLIPKGKKNPRAPSIAQAIPLPMSKRSKVSDRTEIIIPYDDYKNLQAFVENYVENNKFSQPIRWAESTRAQLTLALGKWGEPIKDTQDIVERKINAYLKDCANEGHQKPNTEALQDRNEQSAKVIDVENVT